MQRWGDKGGSEGGREYAREGEVERYRDREEWLSSIVRERYRLHFCKVLFHELNQIWGEIKIAKLSTNEYTNYALDLIHKIFKS